MKNELLNNLISEDNISTKNLTEKDIEYILEVENVDKKQFRKFR